MVKLVWDRPGSRNYETGLDRGVLYLPDGSAVPWNGLTSFSETIERSSNPIFFDGRQISDLISIGAFEGTLTAVTYPKEFEDLEGIGTLRNGVSVTGQNQKTFGLCYRTKIGNDLSGEDEHYKLHVLFNLWAIPSERSYETLTEDPAIVEFEWTITAIPEEIPGYRPTAELIFDSRKIDPWLLEDLEDILYGFNGGDARLLPMKELVTFLTEWYRVKIVDNGDGTWTAISDRPGFIQFMNEVEDLFRIININAVYLDETTFLISDTSDFSEIPILSVQDNGDGTWTASSSYSTLISVNNDGYFEIRNADVVFESSDMYRLSETLSN